MLKKILLVIGGAAVVSSAIAQSTPSVEEEVIIYKWREGGRVHYSKWPPRGVGNVIRLDDQGLVIRDDSEDDAVFQQMRPMRPGGDGGLVATTGGANPANAAARPGGFPTEAAPLPEGAVSKEERCAQAKRDIIVIKQSSGQPINVEDANGNLVPMSETEIQSRLKNAQALVDRLCQ